MSENRLQPFDEEPTSRYRVIEAALEKLTERIGTMETAIAELTKATTVAKPDEKLLSQMNIVAKQQEQVSGQIAALPKSQPKLTSLQEPSDELMQSQMQHYELKSASLMDILVWCNMLGSEHAEIIQMLSTIRDQLGIAEG